MLKLLVKMGIMCDNGILIAIYKEDVQLYYILKNVISVSLDLLMPLTQGVWYLSSIAKNRKVVCGLTG